MSSKQRRVSIKSANQLVGLASSQRLSAMRNASKKVASQPIKSKPLTELEQARLVIEQKITAIKASYPDGKRHSLFALRYVSEKKLQTMSIGELFNLLQLDKGLFKPLFAYPYRD